MKNLSPLFSRIFQFFRKHFVVLSSALILLGCWGMLEFSCIHSLYELKEFLFLSSLKYIVLNYLTLGVVWSVLLILFRRIWAADLLCCILCGGLAIANHYVISFHSMPLSFLLIKNFTTAMNVISGYRFTVGFHVGTLLLAMAALTVLCLLVRRKETAQEKRPLRRQLIRDVSLVLLSACVLFFGYFGPKPLKPVKTIGWLWNEAYSTYGYLGCSIETLTQLFNSVTEPEGYSEDRVSQIRIPGSSQDEPAVSVQPDILLILNETFYDLRQIMDLETDVPYLDSTGSLENLLSGYAVVPNAGGSTNVSEYELLTSNSAYLMPGVTPFNILDLNGANSVVSLLAAQGYSSLACHPEPPASYSRVMAYPRLGFQRSFFQDDFTDLRFYGSRYFETDACVYENLIRWYEADPSDAPRFFYVLTLQNHGGWDLNPPELDLVHLTTDAGEHTGKIEEFLSCISISDEAFRDLTEYFSRSERPVIICMLGDHSPSFAPSVVDPAFSEEEKALNLRKVPLLIWANFPLPEMELGTMSMNFVVPTVLELAGAKLSPYYRYLLQLKEQVPIVSSYGSYYDRDGNIYQYSTDEGAPYAQAVDNYFYLEYHNLQKDRDQSLFLPES